MAGKWTRDTDKNGNTTGMGHRDPRREGGSDKHQRDGHTGDEYKPDAHKDTTMHRERGSGREGNKK